jgi:hypothetical protein
MAPRRQREARKEAESTVYRLCREPQTVGKPGYWVSSYLALTGEVGLVGKISHATNRELQSEEPVFFDVVLCIRR